MHGFHEHAATQLSVHPRQDSTVQTKARSFQGSTVPFTSLEMTVDGVSVHWLAPNAEWLSGMLEQAREALATVLAEERAAKAAAASVIEAAEAVAASA